MNGVLSADGSPESVKPAGVRRLNAVPLFIGGCILLVVASLVVWVAIEKGQQQETPKDSTDHGGNASDFATQVVGDRAGFVHADYVATPTPAPTPVATPVPTPDTTESDARHKAFYQALFAQSAVSLPQQPAAEQQTTVTPEEAARAIPVGTPGDLSGAAPTPRDPNSLRAYNGTKDRWALANRPEPPASPYVLQTGSLIPALLISGMESELPGVIIAQVAEDVSDSPSGRYLLIPQGSKLIGEYSNMIAYGQSRLFVAWQRIVFPNGWTMDIGAQPGVDGQGEAGFHDQVDNHYVRLFGSALLMSAITGGIAFSQNQGQGYSSYQAPNAGSVLSAALGQQLGNATFALLEKNLSIPPTLKIRQGYRLNVLAVKDLVFDRPYVVPNY
jgi:type IV secretory pathway VirB10-like protein